MDERKGIMAVRAEARENIADVARDEKERKAKAWGIYGKGFEHYSATFGLPRETLPDFIESVRRRHTPFGLDLLSGTQMLASLNIGGIAVGLTDARSEKQRAKDKGKRWQTTYDLLNERKQAWRAIRQGMISHHIPAFDLITQRGLMGFDLITPDPHLHFYHLQQMWLVLSTGGMILTEIGTTDSQLLKDHRTYDFWNSIVGVHAYSTPWRGLQLFKYQGAPQKLPINITPTLEDLKKWKLKYQLR